MSVYLRDLDGTGSMHVCAKGDPGAVEYIPVDCETHVVVPGEPTEAMIKAAISAVDSPSYMVTRGWRAMLAALTSPNGGEI